VALFLKEQGFTDVAVLKGGWQAWVDGRHPTVALTTTSPRQQ